MSTDHLADHLAEVVVTDEAGRRYRLTEKGAAAIRERLREIAREYRQRNELHSSDRTRPARPGSEREDAPGAGRDGGVSPRTATLAPRPFPFRTETATAMPKTPPCYDCEGCHDNGGNWDCYGENADDEYCPCENCTGSDACPECGR